MRGNRLHFVLALVTALGLLLIYLTVSGFKTQFTQQLLAISNVAQQSVLQSATVPNVTEPSPPYLIPSDEEIQKMDENQMMHVYWRYINMLQTLCYDIVRIGSLKDGGKEICIDEEFKPSTPCLVYSFGINYLWDFDEAIVKNFGCEVHCFDPSMRKETGRVNEYIWFYKWGLGGRNGVNNKGWNIMTLDEIRKKLGHTNRTIDILKIDIEGSEWESIPQMLTSGALDDVKQISMETHFSKDKPHLSVYWGDAAPSLALKALRQLYDFGYRIFMRERNMWSYQTWPTFRHHITNVNEISVIKHQKKSRSH